MEYVYAALILHSAGKKVTDEAVSAVIKAAGIEVDAVRAKALVAALDGVNIEEAIAKAAFAAPAAAAPAVAAAAPAAAAEKPKEEEKAKEKAEESGMEGLGALFG
ncbi:MAG: 50S ribosomal protein P1 [Candidatus Methanoperedens sp.]|nr:50S ribosomal protein P1 [Candidatus Methanoperedens sp.]MCE8425850.1 50S ribosomal protein P1 [Candidatus Methanoperedens sp.]MCE8427632.1 50S ribosomal protein P1 [Candidatus Methanoperedens sp.]